MSLFTPDLILASLALLGWLYLAFLRGLFWKPLVDSPAAEPDRWPSVDIVVPARNEADALPLSLPSLLAQNYPGEWRLLLIDDHSADGTGSVARRLANEKGSAERLTVIEAPDLPEGWTGKVAAMQAGVRQSASDYILFTDADIAHPSHSLRRLVARSMADNLDLNSLMVRLNVKTFSEKLLIPAFVFFFAMLYPFRLANKPSSRVAAAAGGVMLVNKKALANIGGLARIKGALIDDCSLARVIKDNAGNYGAPGRIRLTLARDVHSLRPYPSINSVMRMIARTAFTQLRHSYALLFGTVAGLCLLFFAPVAIPLFANAFDSLVAYAALLIMILIYIPVVHFYGISWIWALTLPAAALIYILATILSAWQYSRGKGGQWKGRSQAS